MKPGQAQLMSMQGQRKPTAAAMMQPSPGVMYSLTTLEQSRRSMSSGFRPASASAFRAASRPRSSSRSSEMTWRERMPVRVTIHSSVVSRKLSRSPLVTTFFGRALPVPMIFICSKGFGNGCKSRPAEPNCEIKVAKTGPHGRMWGEIAEKGAKSRFFCVIL